MWRGPMRRYRWGEFFRVEEVGWRGGSGNPRWGGRHGIVRRAWRAGRRGVGRSWGGGEGGLAEQTAECAGDADSFWGEEDIGIGGVAGAETDFGGAVWWDRAAVIEPVEVFEGGVPIATGAGGDDGGDFALADGCVGADEDEVFVEDTVTDHGIAFDAEEEVAGACVEQSIDGDMFCVVAFDGFGEGACGD